MLHFCYQITDFSLLASPFNTLSDAKKSPENSGLFGIFTMEDTIFGYKKAYN